MRDNFRYENLTEGPYFRNVPVYYRLLTKLEFHRGATRRCQCLLLATGAEWTGCSETCTKRRQPHDPHKPLMLFEHVSYFNAFI